MTLNVTVPDTVYRRLPSWLQLLQGIREVRSLERRELRTREISGLEGYYEIGPAFTASSRTKSSLGSGRSGRQRKKIGRRFALAHKKCTTVDIAAAQISAVQTRLSVCSYSKTKGTDRFMRHRSSPTNRSRR